MKINDVLILNWKAPGEKWWDAIERRPDEQLIEVRFDLTMSLREYHDLLGKARSAGHEGAGVSIPPGGVLSAPLPFECEGKLEQIQLPWWKRKLMDFVFRGT